MTWLLVAAGGAIGSALRHGLNQLIHQRFLSATFPIGIFLVNVIGSTAIGMIAGLLASGRLHLSDESRIFLIVGVLGGFTTFSSFSLDTLTLLKAGHLAKALINVGGQVGLSLLGVWLGFKFSAAR